MRQQTQSTFIRLDPGWKEILSEIAEQDGCSLSDVIRKALIREYRLPLKSQKMRLESLNNREPQEVAS